MMNTSARTSSSCLRTALAAFIALACAAALFLALAPSALAKQVFVQDNYGLYDQETYAELEAEAEDLASTYGVATYLVTVRDIGVDTVRSYAESYWIANGLGLGDDESGIMFLIAVESRDYVTITRGQGIYNFTDYGIEQLEDAVVSYLGDDEWEDAAFCYLEQCDDIMTFCAENGEPLDYDNDPGNLVFGFLMCLVLAIIVGFLVSKGVKGYLLGQLKSVAKGSSATHFIEGGVTLSKREDVFLGSHVTAVPLPKDDDGPSGGSTVSSSGFGGSSGGKF